MTADRLADCYLQSSNSSQRNVNSMYCNCSQLKETAVAVARARSPSTCSAPCHVTLYSPNVYGARFMGNAETQILGGIYIVAKGGSTAQRERFTAHRIDPGRLHQSAFKLNNMQRLLHDANKFLDFAHFNEVPDGAATHME